jgi:hypothetical protein
MTNVRSTPIIASAITFAAICFGLSNPTRLYAVPSQMSHKMSGTVRRIVLLLVRMPNLLKKLPLSFDTFQLEG